MGEGVIGAAVTGARVGLSDGTTVRGHGRGLWAFTRSRGDIDGRW
jgi:hypothetical protein